MATDLHTDNAVASFCHTSHYCIQLRNGTRDVITLQAAFSKYGRTVELLRNELGTPTSKPSDHVLIAISLMAYVDLMLAGMSGSTDFRASYNHFDAVKAILLARPRTSRHSDLTRALVPTIAVLDFYWLTTRANVAVRPSAFDNDRYWGMEPFSQHTPPSELQTLQQRSFQFRIRLPRLLSLVKGTTDSSCAPSEIIKLLTIAETLLSLEDRESENVALHQVKVKLTLDPSTNAIAPYSFDFQSVYNWPIAIQYWEGLLMTICLALKVDLLHTKAFYLNWLSTEERQRLIENQDRIASNILMSYEYAASHGRFGKAQIAHPLLIVWGALANKTATSTGKPVTKVKEWIFKTLQVAGTTHLRPQTMQDLDVLADLFAGTIPQDNVETTNHARKDSAITVRSRTTSPKK